MNYYQYDASCVKHKEFENTFVGCFSCWEEQCLANLEKEEITDEQWERMETDNGYIY